MMAALLDALTFMANEFALLSFPLSALITTLSLLFAASTVFLRIFHWQRVVSVEDVHNVLLLHTFLLILLLGIEWLNCRRKKVFQQSFHMTPIGCYSHWLSATKCHFLKRLLFLSLPLLVYLAIVCSFRIRYGIEFEHFCQLPKAISEQTLNFSDYYCWPHGPVIFVKIFHPHWEAMFCSSIVNCSMAGLFIICNWKTYLAIVRFAWRNYHQHKEAIQMGLLLAICLIYFFALAFTGSAFWSLVSLGQALRHSPVTAEGLAFFFAALQASYCLMLSTSILEMILINCQLISHHYVYRQINCTDQQIMHIIVETFSNSASSCQYFRLASFGQGLLMQALIDLSYPEAAYPRILFTSWDQLPVSVPVYFARLFPARDAAA